MSPSPISVARTVLESVNFEAALATRCGAARNDGIGQVNDHQSDPSLRRDKGCVTIVETMFGT